MNNVLEEYKTWRMNKMSTSYHGEGGYFFSGWEQGFDAAIELGLSVKFDEWKLENGFENGMDGCWHIPETVSQDEKVGISQVRTPQSLFDYWLNNIFKIDEK